MPISDNITNGLIVSGRLKTAIRNAPAQYAGRRRQYLGDPSTEFVHQYAKYATDFFAARVQGLNPDAPYEWETTMIRMADIAPETASTLRKQDDYKNIIFADESIEYVPERKSRQWEVSGWSRIHRTSQTRLAAESYSAAGRRGTIWTGTAIS